MALASSILKRKKDKTGAWLDGGKNYKRRRFCGSLFGPQKPASANANYVMTMPKQGWFTYFRFYGPKETYFDKTWQLPDLDEVK